MQISRSSYFYRWLRFFNQDLDYYRLKETDSCTIFNHFIKASFLSIAIILLFCVACLIAGDIIAYFAYIALNLELIAPTGLTVAGIVIFLSAIFLVACENFSNSDIEFKAFKIIKAKTKKICLKIDITD